MENVNSRQKVVKKQKRVQRIVEYYNFPIPLKVLMDKIVFRAIHDKEIGKSLISSYLKHDVQLYVTSCTIAEAGVPQILSEDYVSLESCHQGEETAKGCFQDVIGSTNPSSYFVATGSSKLSSKLQQIPSVPVIMFRKGAVHLKKPSVLQKISAGAKDTRPVSDVLSAEMCKTTDKNVKGAHKRKSGASVSETAPRIQAKDAGPVSDVLLAEVCQKKSKTAHNNVKGAHKRKSGAFVAQTSSEDSTIQAKDAGPVSDVLLAEVCQKKSKTAHKNVKGAHKRKSGAFVAQTSSEDSTIQVGTRNTIGDVPFDWYKYEDHVGYDRSGQRIIKGKKEDKIDQFFSRADNQKSWFKRIQDEVEAEEVEISNAEYNVAKKLVQGKAPGGHFF